MPGSFIEIDTETGKPVVIGDRVAILPVEPAHNPVQVMIGQEPTRHTGLLLLGLSLSGALLMWRGKRGAARPSAPGQ